MSNSETQCGWFLMILGAGREALCYRCAACTVFSMGHERVWCCGQWKTPPKPGFWGEKLPRLPYIAAPRGLTVMPSSGFEITD
jgi:hypothetical protein